MAFGLNIAIICSLFNFAIIPSLLEIRGFQPNSSLIFLLPSISGPYFYHTLSNLVRLGTRRNCLQRRRVVTSTSYSEVSDTSSVAEDFCEHLGLIFFLSQQVWSHRLWQVKDVQPASRQNSPNQCEEKHKRHRLCSSRIRNRNCSSAHHWGVGWARKFSHADSFISLKGLLWPPGMAYIHLKVQTYDVSHPSDITGLGQGKYEEPLRPGVLRKDMGTASTSTWDISKTHVSMWSPVCSGLEFKLKRCRDGALVG